MTVDIEPYVNKRVEVRLIDGRSAAGGLCRWVGDTATGDLYLGPVLRVEGVWARHCHFHSTEIAAIELLQPQRKFTWNDDVRVIDTVEFEDSSTLEMREADLRPWSAS